jgi:hypothetical protein
MRKSRRSVFDWYDEVQCFNCGANLGESGE